MKWYLPLDCLRQWRRALHDGIPLWKRLRKITFSGACATYHVTKTIFRLVARHFLFSLKKISFSTFIFDLTYKRFIYLNIFSSEIPWSIQQKENANKKEVWKHRSAFSKDLMNLEITTWKYEPWSMDPLRGPGRVHQNMDPSSRTGFMDPYFNYPT